MSKVCRHCHMPMIGPQREYCNGSCERLASGAKNKLSRAHAIKLIRNAEADVLSARERLRDVAQKAVDEGYLSREAIDLVAGEVRFEAEAVRNRDNVVANKVKAFCLAHERELQNLLRLYCFNSALDAFDMELMWNRIVGHPQPIVVAPEPSLSEYIDDELDDAAA